VHGPGFRASEREVSPNGPRSVRLMAAGGAETRGFCSVERSSSTCCVARSPSLPERASKLPENRACDHRVVAVASVSSSLADDYVHVFHGELPHANEVFFWLEGPALSDLSGYFFMHL